MCARGKLEICPTISHRTIASIFVYLCYYCQILFYALLFFFFLHSLEIKNLIFQYSTYQHRYEPASGLLWKHCAKFVEHFE